MDFLKKRSVAIAVSIIVILLSTIFGVNRSMGKLADNIEDKFYSGVGTETALNDYLENGAGKARMLCIITANYNELSGLTEELKGKYTSLYDEDSIEGKYDLNSKMKDSFYNLYDALNALNGVSAKHLSDAKIYADDMANIQNMILKSSYNNEVDQYFVKLNAFPVIVFKLLVFSDAPEYFAVHAL